MLRNEADGKVLTNLILHSVGGKTKPWLKEESEQLLEQIEQFNYRVKFYDPDIARWSKEHMNDFVENFSVEDGLTLRKMVIKSSIHMWGRARGKTTVSQFLAAYQAISEGMAVVILLPNEQLNKCYKRFLEYMEKNTFKMAVASSRATASTHEMHFKNGGSITLANKQLIEELNQRLEIKRMNGFLEEENKVHIIADEFDSFQMDEQQVLLESISRITNRTKGLFTIISTPLIYSKDGVQEFTPLQYLIDNKLKGEDVNNDYFTFEQKGATQETIDHCMKENAIALYPRERILSELEGGFNLAEPSILLGE